MARRLGAGLAAAVITGLALGLVARALMRVMTLVAGGTPAFSWSGTAFIVGAFLACALPGCVVAAFVSRRRRVVLALGVLPLMVPAVAVGVQEVAALPTVTPVQGVAIALVALGIAATVLLMPAFALRVLDPLLARPRASAAPEVRARPALG